MPHKRKKRGKEKQKKWGGEKAKGKRRNGSETFSKILLSAHAWTLKAVIWHQEQKLVQCSTCKHRFGQFGFFLARQRPKNWLDSFQKAFFDKMSRSQWVSLFLFSIAKVTLVAIIAREFGHEGTVHCITYLNDHSVMAGEGGVPDNPHECWYSHCGVEFLQLNATHRN